MSKKDQAADAMAAMTTAHDLHGAGSAPDIAATDQAIAAVIDANRAGVSFGEIDEETNRRL